MAEKAQQQKKSKKPKSITITLSEPIEWGDETIEEVTLRRPKGKELKMLSGDPSMDDLLKIAGKCGGLTPRQIDDMDADDALALAEAVGDFLDSGHQIGKKVKF